MRHNAHDIFLRNETPVAGVIGVAYVITAHKVITMLEYMACKRLIVGNNKIIVPVYRYVFAGFPFKNHLVYLAFFGSKLHKVTRARKVERSEILYSPWHMSYPRDSTQLAWVKKAVWDRGKLSLSIQQSYRIRIIAVLKYSVHNSDSVPRCADASLSIYIVYYEINIAIMMREVENHYVIRSHISFASCPVADKFSSFFVEIKIIINSSTHDSFVYYYPVARHQRGHHRLRGCNELVEKKYP